MNKAPTFQDLDFHDLHQEQPDRYEEGSRYAQLLMPNGYMVTVIQAFEHGEEPQENFEIMLFEPDEQGQMRVATRHLRELAELDHEEHASSLLDQTPEQVEAFLKNVYEQPDHRCNTDVNTLFQANEADYQVFGKSQGALSSRKYVPG